MPMQICVSYPLDVCYLIIYTKKMAGQRDRVELRRFFFHYAVR